MARRSDDLSIDEIRHRYADGARPVSTHVLNKLQRDPRQGARKLYETLRKRYNRDREERLRLDAMRHFELVVWKSGVTHIAGQVFTSGTPQVVNDAKSDPRHSSRVDESLQHRTESLATVPIRYPGGRPLGVLQLVNRPGGFLEEDLASLEALASIVALSISVRISRSASTSS